MKNQDNSLYIKKPNGRYALAHEDVVIQSANEILDSHYQADDLTTIGNPSDARAYLYMRTNWEYESFDAIFMEVLGWFSCTH